MRTLRNLAVLSLMIIALFGASASASAAESYDSCAGFIDTVPATITTQGTWCLRHNLSTSATGIHAIEIQNSNVTIDCNGFKIGNGPAGTNTNSVGIFSEGFANIPAALPVPGVALGEEWVKARSVSPKIRTGAILTKVISGC